MSFVRFPQQDVLGHPKTRAFITQGGIISVQEALFHAVPMLFVPMFADQSANAHRAMRQGYGIRIEPKSTYRMLSHIRSVMGEQLRLFSVANILYIYDLLDCQLLIRSGIFLNSWSFNYYNSISS